MDVAPPRALGLLIGVALLLAGVAAVVLGLGELVEAEISPALVLWAALPIAGAGVAGIAAYRLYGLATARYAVDRDGIGIRWGLALEEMPLGQARVERPPQDRLASLRPRGGVRWPGCVVGTQDVPGLGPVEFFATRGGSGLLLVRSAERTLAISPPDPEAFLRAFTAALRQGSLRPVTPVSSRPDLFATRLWRDPAARLLIFVGTGLPLVLLGFLGLRASSLPKAVPFGFDAQGLPDSPAPPGRLLLLPLIGGLCWTIDLALGSAFYRRQSDRILGYAMWGLGIVVNLLLWAAAIALISAAASGF